MNFLEVLESEEAQLGRYAKSSIMCESIINLAVESVDPEDPLAESVIALLEATNVISAAEKNIVTNDVNATGVKLFKGMDGERSFAIINKNKVIYVADGGKKLTLTKSEWNTFEKSLVGTGMKRVKDKSEMTSFMKFMSSASTGMTKPLQLIVAYGVRIIAMSIGVAYSSAIVNGIANAVKAKTGEPLSRIVKDIIMGKSQKTEEVEDWTSIAAIQVFERDSNHEN